MLSFLVGNKKGVWGQICFWNDALSRQGGQMVILVGSTHSPEVGVVERMGSYDGFTALSLKPDPRDLSVPHILSSV